MFLFSKIVVVIWILKKAPIWQHLLKTTWTTYIENQTMQSFLKHFTSINRLSQVIKVLYSVQNFNNEFLYFEASWIQKRVFRNCVCVYMCVCVIVWSSRLQKKQKEKKRKKCMYKSRWVYKLVSDFCKNREAGREA